MYLDSLNVFEMDKYPVADLVDYPKDPNVL